MSNVWWRSYSGQWRETFKGDLIAGITTTLMLVPQSLAYAMLAGLPPSMGLYASVLPLLAYAVFGSSMTMAVGPVAIIALMTASAVQPLLGNVAAGADQVAMAVHLAGVLALMSGIALLTFGLLRFGFLANLLSHSVVGGFVSGAAVVIAFGQLRPLLGIKNWAEAVSIFSASASAIIGLTSLILLVLAKRFLRGTAARLAPVLVIGMSVLVVVLGNLDHRFNVAVVGAVPAGLPSLTLPLPTLFEFKALAVPALLLALIGFVESVSVARNLAQRRGEKIIPNRELLGTGAANIASAVSGGMPVTGGLSRSVVSFSAGANTPMAGVISAFLMALVLLFASQSVSRLPLAALAATIIVAVSTLFDWRGFLKTLSYDKGDALAFALTFFGVIGLGVEQGIILGVVLSLAVMVWRGSHPHIAVVGRVPGTEHFRNIHRHDVETLPTVLALRVDENLFFANVHVLEDTLEQALQQDRSIKHVLLILSAVNHIDATGLHALQDIVSSLKKRGLALHFSEVKGPVMDKLETSDLLQQLGSAVHQSTHQAFNYLSSQT